MKKVLLLLFTTLLLTNCAIRKQADYKIYCKKGDPSSIRIIPKYDPFIPISDSIKRNFDISISNLKSFESKVKIENKREYNEKVKDLENSAYIDLSILKSHYIAFRSQPCNPDAYNNYITSLNSLNKRLEKVEELKSDINKLVNGDGISGNSDEKVILSISKYLNTL